MGFHEAMIPMAFFVIAICAIALSSINIQTYLTTNKAKDSNFNFSCVILAFSILALGVSGYFTFQSFKAPAPEVVQAAVAQAKALNEGAIQSVENAIPTTNQVQGLNTPNAVRAAQSEMNSNIDKLISSLQETKGMKNQQLQARLQGLIAAAQAMAAATAGSG